MLTIQQKPCAPGNFHIGRNGHPLVGIVIHITAAQRNPTNPGAGTDAWFANPVARVSAHYLVCGDGSIHQFVQESDAAYHAGVVDRPTWKFAIDHPTLVNYSTIGIEHEGLATEDITEAQYAASQQLIADISQRHGLAIGPETVVPHHAIRFGKTCPGLIDIGRLINARRESPIT